MQIVKTKNEKSYTVATGLTETEAVKKIALLVDEAAMQTNYYNCDVVDGKILITDPDTKQTIFTEGEKDASIGDIKFEIIEQ